MIACHESSLAVSGLAIADARSDPESMRRCAMATKTFYIFTGISPPASLARHWWPPLAHELWHFRALLPLALLSVRVAPGRRARRLLVLDPAVSHLQLNTFHLELQQLDGACSAAECRLVRAHRQSPATDRVSAGRLALGLALGLALRLRCHTSQLDSINVLNHRRSTPIPRHERLRQRHLT